jgi:hypothetical protein
MFQYSHAWALQHHWPARTFIDLIGYREASLDRAYRIEDVVEMPDCFPHLSESAASLIKGLRLDRRNRSEELTIKFKQSCLSHDLRGIVQGYFPSFKYSTGIQDLVRRNFQFRKPLPARNERLAEELLDEKAVAVHVRRGDYLNPENKADFYGMCTPAYYRASIDYVRCRQPNAKFYFFSDDPSWCRAEFSDVAQQVVEGNEGEDAWADMALMSRCRSAIIANSSYSLWARWLSAEKGGINLCPAYFFNDGAYGARPDDIFPDSYVRIDALGALAVVAGR